MQQYLDLLRHVRLAGAAQERPHRDRHAVGVRLPDALRPGRRVSRWSPPRSCTVRSIVHELLWFLRGDTNVALSAASTASRSGTNGPMRTASSARSMASSGAHWPTPRRRHDRPDRRGGRPHPQQSRFAAAHRVAPGTRPTSTAWRCRRATRCSSSTSRTAGCPASSTSAAPTSSSACRSTSPPMRC